MVSQLSKFLICIHLMLLLSLVAACKGKDPEGKHVFSGQEQALRKAEALQGQLDERERKNRKMVGDAFK